MPATLDDGRLRLSGYVGDYYYEDGFTSSDVVLALAGIDENADLPCHINSPGGIATEGAAIHAILSARPGQTHIIVEGIAMSAASLIAMAGDTVTMSAGSVMMIHDPSGATWGTSADHQKSIDSLEALSTAYARVYADKSGKTVEECRQIMKDETWFTPEQAVEAGFADETTERRGEPVAAFDYRVLQHAPKRLTAMAKKKDWHLPDANKAATAASPRPKKEPSMAETTNGGEGTVDLAKAVASAKERIKAIMTSDEAKGREAQAEHFAYNTEMSADDAIAAMKTAPKAQMSEPNGETQQDPAPRLFNASGLGGGKPAPGAEMRVDIVGNMKRQYGVKA